MDLLKVVMLKEYVVIVTVAEFSVKCFQNKKLGGWGMGQWKSMA